MFYSRPVHTIENQIQETTNALELWELDIKGILQIRWLMLKNNKK